MSRFTELAQRLLEACQRRDSANLTAKQADLDVKMLDEEIERYRADCDHSLKFLKSWPVDYGQQSPVNMVRQWRCVNCLMLVDENVRQEKGKVFDPWRSGWYRENSDKLMAAAHKAMMR